MLSSMKLPVLLNAQFELGLRYNNEAPFGAMSASYLIPLIVSSLSPQLICKDDRSVEIVVNVPCSFSAKTMI